MHPPHVLALLPALLALPAAAQTVSVTIPVAQDATVYARNGINCGVPNGPAANGAGEYLIADYDTCADEYDARALVQFDVAAAVPAGATITSARLQLVGHQSVFGCCGLHAYAILAPWTEGPSDPPGFEFTGSAPQAGDVTWEYASYPSVPWPGGPHGPPHGAQDALLLPPLPGLWTFPSTPAMVSRAQQWLDQPATNFGWMLESDDVLRMASRESTTSFGPRLVVEYLPPCGAVVNECVGVPNSTGQGATLGWSGSTSVAQNAFTVTLAGGVPNSAGFFFFGPDAQQIPWGNGALCVDGHLYRLLPAVGFTPSGTAQRAIDFQTGPASVVAPYSTWRFQCKYRDVAAGGALFNASDALRVTFCP